MLRLCAAAQLTSKRQRLPGNTVVLTGRSHSHTNTQIHKCTNAQTQSHIHANISTRVWVALHWEKLQWGGGSPVGGELCQSKDNRALWPLTPVGVWTNRKCHGKKTHDGQVVKILLCWGNVSAVCKWQVSDTLTGWQNVTGRSCSHMTTTAMITNKKQQTNSYDDHFTS